MIKGGDKKGEGTKGVMEPEPWSSPILLPSFSKDSEVIAVSATGPEDHSFRDFRSPPNS